MLPGGGPEQIELDKAQRILQILYAAMFAAVAFYWIILEIVLPSALEPAPPVAKQVLMLVAGGSGVAVLFVRFSLLPGLLHQVSTEPARLLTRLRTYYIICYALSDSVALYGFVLGMLGASQGEVVPFFLAAIALFLLCYPRLPERSRGFR
jgi:F0F1-type ATP synthase membrane subunit c/vacuolar-type H+-ATPase subunit K